MLKRKLTHLEAHAIAHRLRQAGEVVAGVVEELMGMDNSPDAQADERGAFEAWASAEGFDLVRHADETYATQECFDAWSGWQARAAAPQPQPAEPKGLTEEQREALKYAVYALKQLTSVQADDALEVIGALLKNGE